MRLSWQFATFTAVGLLSAFVDLGALFIFIQFGLSPYLGITAAFICGLCINLWFHKRFTFTSKLMEENAIRFFLLVGMNYGLTLGVIFFFQQLGQTYIVGKVISLPLVAINGFLWSKHWVFRG